MPYQITINDREFKRAISRLKTASAAVGGATLKAWGNHLIRRIIGRMEKGEAPDGTKWPSRKIDGGIRHLAKSDIRKTLHTTTEMGGLVARIGTPSVYGAIHQFGGTIKPKKAQWLTIPVSKKARHKRARDIGGVVFIKTNPSTALLVKPKKRGTGFVIFYVLKKSVTIPAAPYLGATREEISLLGNYVASAIEQYVLRPGTKSPKMVQGWG